MHSYEHLAKMTEPEVIVSMLRSLFNAIQWNSDIVLERLDIMKKNLNLQMTTMTFNMLLAFLSKDPPKPMIEYMERELKNMNIKHGLDADAFTYNTLLSSHSKLDDIDGFMRV
jgi:hypothetical protein